MKIHCPDCQELIQTPQIDLFANRAECLDCQTAFPFESLLARVRLQLPPKPALPKPPRQ